MKESMTEKVIMELVVNSGNARSLAMEAIQLAKKGNLHFALSGGRKCVLERPLCGA